MKNQITKNGKEYTLLMNKKWKESMNDWYKRFDKELKYFTERFNIIKSSDDPEDGYVVYTLKKYTDE